MRDPEKLNRMPENVEIINRPELCMRIMNGRMAIKTERTDCNQDWFHGVDQRLLFPSLNGSESINGWYDDRMFHGCAVELRINAYLLPCLKVMHEHNFDTLRPETHSPLRQQE